MNETPRRKVLSVLVEICSTRLLLDFFHTLHARLVACKLLTVSTIPAFVLGLALSLVSVSFRRDDFEERKSSLRSWAFNGP